MHDIFVDLCSICLRETAEGEDLTSLNHDTSAHLKTKLKACIPELSIIDLVETVICTSCITLLCISFDFRTLCLEAEKKIKSLLSRSPKRRGSQHAPQNTPPKPTIKSETLETAEEEHNSNSGSQVELSPVKIETVPDDTCTVSSCKGNEDVSPDAEDLPISETFSNNTVEISVEIDVPKTVNDSENLLVEKYHEVIHNNEEDISQTRSFQCRICFATFIWKMNLAKHMTIHRPVFPQQTITSQPKSLKCEHCDKSFSHLFHLNRHKQSHEAVDGEDKSASEESYECTVCRLAFTHKLYFENHMKVHAPINKTLFRCLICNFSYKRKRFLQKHMNSHLPELVRCKVCDIPFSKPRYLQEHMLKHRTDPVVVDHTCSICEVSYKCKRMLTRHMKVHRPKLFHCEICSHSFTYRIQLNRHRKLHENTLPSSANNAFICTICNIPFARKPFLANHMRSHRTKENRIKCKFCVERFTHYLYLRKHMKAVHATNDEPSSEVRNAELHPVKVQPKTQNQPDCDDNSSTPNTSDIHTLTHQKDTSAEHISAIGREIIMCHLCKKCCVSKDQLDVHRCTQLDTCYKNKNVTPLQTLTVAEDCFEKFVQTAGTVDYDSHYYDSAVEDTDYTFYPQDSFNEVYGEIIQMACRRFEGQFGVKMNPPTWKCYVPLKRLHPEVMAKYLVQRRKKRQMRKTEKVPKDTMKRTYKRKPRAQFNHLNMKHWKNVASFCDEQTQTKNEITVPEINRNSYEEDNSTLDTNFEMDLDFSDEDLHVETDIVSVKNEFKHASNSSFLKFDTLPLDYIPAKNSDLKNLELDKEDTTSKETAVNIMLHLDDSLKENNDINNVEEKNISAMREKTEDTQKVDCGTIKNEVQKSKLRTSVVKKVTQDNCKHKNNLSVTHKPNIYTTNHKKASIAKNPTDEAMLIEVLQSFNYLSLTDSKMPTLSPVLSEDEPKLPADEKMPTLTPIDSVSCGCCNVILNSDITSTDSITARSNLCQYCATICNLKWKMDCSQKLVHVTNSCVCHICSTRCTEDEDLKSHLLEVHKIDHNEAFKTFDQNCDTVKEFEVLNKEEETQSSDPKLKDTVDNIINFLNTEIFNDPNEEVSVIKPNESSTSTNSSDKSCNDCELSGEVTAFSYVECNNSVDTITNAVEVKQKSSKRNKANATKLGDIIITGNALRKRKPVCYLPFPWYAKRERKSSPKMQKTISRNGLTDKLDKNKVMINILGNVLIRSGTSSKIVENCFDENIAEEDDVNTTSDKCYNSPFNLFSYINNRSPFKYNCFLAINLHQSIEVTVNVYSLLVKLYKHYSIHNFVINSGKILFLKNVQRSGMSPMVLNDKDNLLHGFEPTSIAENSKCEYVLFHTKKYFLQYSKEFRFGNASIYYKSKKPKPLKLSSTFFNLGVSSFILSTKQFMEVHSDYSKTEPKHKKRFRIIRTDATQQENALFCSVCEVRCKTNNSFKAHCSSVLHKRKDAVVCKQCHVTFRSQKKQKVHVKKCKVNNPTQNPPLKVHIAVEKYIPETELRKLKNDIKTVIEKIEKIKKYKCKYCEKAFVTKSQVKTHKLMFH